MGGSLGGWSGVLISEFLRAAVRRWYVVLLGGVVTLLAFAVLTDRPPLYTARVTLTVVSPAPPGGSSSLQQPVPPVVASAAVMRVNGRAPALAASSADALLVGRTQRPGDDVRLAHFGNQWTASALYPTIIVEAVDVTPEAVQARIERRVQDVRGAMKQLEQEMDVSRSQRVGLSQSPPTPLPAYVPTSRPRAAVGTGVVGVGLTCWAVLGVDTLLRRRRGRRS